MTARTRAPLFALALLVALPASAHAGGPTASAIGVAHAGGQTVYVDVLVAVPPGQSDRQATDSALAEQGARRSAKPPWAGGPGGGGGGDDQFFYTGLKWSPPSVVQNYNPTGQPFDASAALRRTHAAWSQGSDFSMSAGNMNSNSCPSLVQQCKGPQFTDGQNDVGWLSIGGSTLGVTWWVVGDEEADMALNTRFLWNNTCDDTASGYSVETVFLHENGHVAGLDHTNTADSVMYPSYQRAMCSPTAYDQAAMANLYG